MYNSTPHSTTSNSTSELIYHLQFRDKLLSIIDLKSFEKEEVRDKDWEMRKKGKELEDMKRRANDRNLDVGGRVYLKI